MARTITIELDDKLEAEAKRIFTADLKPEDVAVGPWADETVFWRDVVVHGLDVIQALQHPLPDTEPESAPDPDGIPF